MSDQGFDINALLQQAQEMQQRLMEAQEETAQQTVAGQSGGGVVRIEASGDGAFRSVTIDPSCVDPADVDMLQDLVLAALHDVTEQLQELAQEAMGGFPGMPGMPGLTP